MGRCQPKCSSRASDGDHCAGQIAGDHVLWLVHSRSCPVSVTLGLQPWSESWLEVLAGTTSVKCKKGPVVLLRLCGVATVSCYTVTRVKVVEVFGLRPRCRSRGSPKEAGGEIVRREFGRRLHLWATGIGVSVRVARSPLAR